MAYEQHCISVWSHSYTQESPVSHSAVHDWNSYLWPRTNRICHCHPVQRPCGILGDQRDKSAISWLSDHRFVEHVPGNCTTGPLFRSLLCLESEKGVEAKREEENDLNKLDICSAVDHLYSRFRPL